MHPTRAGGTVHCHCSHLLKLGYRRRQVQDVVAALEKGVDPRKYGIVLDSPRVGRTLHGRLSLVVEVRCLKAPQDLIRTRVGAGTVVDPLLLKAETARQRRVRLTSE